MSNVRMSVAAWKVLAVKKYLELKATDECEEKDIIKTVLETVQDQYPSDFKNLEYNTIWNRIYDLIHRSKTGNDISEALKNGNNIELVSTTVETRSYSMNGEELSASTEKQKYPSAEQNIVELKNNKDGSRTAVVDFKNETTSPNEMMNELTLLRHLNLDPEVWTVKDASVRNGRHEAIMKGGKIEELHSYRISATVKLRTAEDISQELLLNAFEERSKKANRDQKYERIEVVGENLAVFSIADLHLGKLAWDQEVGESYDYKICRDRFFYVVNKAITAMKKIPDLEKVVFFWTQDFFHYDNIKITTTAGTQQDTDIRWQKLFTIGCDMICDAIQMLREELNVPIQSFYTRSNHDMQVSYYALNYVYAWFRNDPNVIIDRAPIGRKYIEYGVNLMGFGHGDEEGKRIHQLMQIEQPVAWGRTLNHEWFLGHFHKLALNDEGGVRATYLSSVTGTDAWHYNSGYLGAMKQAQVHVRNKHEGPIGVIDINILKNN